MVMLRRFVVNTFVVWPMLGLYLLINHHQSTAPSTVLMPSWVPFWPAFFPIYCGLMLVTWLLPALISHPGLFRSCLRANVFGYLLVMPWWILAPTMMPRPPLPEGAWADSFQWIWALDQPFNIMPCAHGVGPVVVAWFLGRDRPAWRWPLAGMLVVALPSIALVWQHRPIDILFGTGAAVIGITLGEILGRRERTGTRSV